MSEMTDRELDCEIAEKVMGHTFWQNYAANSIRQVEIVHRGASPTLENAKRVESPSWRGAWEIGRLPPYSSSIADAWRVVEEMKNRGWNASMTYYHLTKQWCIFFWSSQTGMPAIRYASVYIERAICGAAIAALESERAK